MSNTHIHKITLKYLIIVVIIVSIFKKKNLASVDDVFIILFIRQKYVDILNYSED